MKCINYKVPSKHNVEVGYLRKRKFFRKYAAGIATREANRGFFNLKLNVFPENTYYIVKNEKNDEYTVFTKKTETEDGFKFTHAIGTGRKYFSADKKVYLRLLIPLLRLEVFMRCSPINEEQSQALEKSQSHDLKLCA